MHPFFGDTQRYQSPPLNHQRSSVFFMCETLTSDGRAKLLATDCTSAKFGPFFSFHHQKCIKAKIIWYKAKKKCKIYFILFLLYFFTFIPNFYRKISRASLRNIRIFAQFCHTALPASMTKMWNFGPSF